MLGVALCSKVKRSVFISASPELVPFLDLVRPPNNSHVVTGQTGAIRQS